jgi:hypothetical protein
MLEAMACRERMAVAANLLLNRIRMTSDCSNVVNIVQEIKARARSFQKVEFVHEGRNSNMDAHTLATSLIYLNVGRHVWLPEPPDGICKQQTIIS